MSETTKRRWLTIISALGVGAALTTERPVMADSNGLPAFSGVVVVGDSIEDNGNLFEILGAPDAPWFMGRFSNGPTWAELVPEMLGVPPENVTNLAVAGATSFDFLNLQVTPLVEAGPLDPNALYLVDAGAPNDMVYIAFFGGVPIDVVLANAEANFRSSISLLAAAGARHFGVRDWILLGNTPFFPKTDPAFTQQADQAVREASAMLGSVFEELESDLGIEIARVPIVRAYDEMKGNPGAFGFTNTTDGAVQPDDDPQFFLDPQAWEQGQVATNNPDEFLLWDWVHPTRRGHEVIADFAFGAITCPSDLTFDGRVNFRDIVEILSNFRDPYTFNDLINILANWGSCPEAANAE